MVVRLISKLILAAVCFSGCATQNAGTEDRDRYVDFCREMARAPIPEREDPEDFMTKPDWMVHPCSLTTQEFKKDYKVVYADRQCLSFSCCDYAYTGGAHGNTTIAVGTIDRKTGKTLTLEDVPAFADRGTLKKKLHEAVVAKIGKNALQDEVKPHDNFYLAKDGWHFVYNQYEVACYAEGAIEVVIKR